MLLYGDDAQVADDAVNTNTSCYSDVMMLVSIYGVKVLVGRAALGDPFADSPRRAYVQGLSVSR